MLDLPPEIQRELLDRSVRIGGGILLALSGVALVALDRRSPATRAFALVLAAIGGDIVIDSLDDPLADAGAISWPSFVYADVAASIVLAAAVVRFVTTFPRPRGLLGSDRGGRIVWGTAAGLLLLLAIAPRLYVDPSERVFDYGHGPLGFMLGPPVLVVGAAALARSWLDETDPSVRRSTQLAASGFVMIAASEFTLRATIYLLRHRGDLFASYGSWVYVSNEVAHLLLGAALLPILFDRAWRARRRGEPGATLFLASIGIGAAGAVLYRGVFDIRLGDLPIGDIGRGIPYVGLAVLTAYGILRHRLFGIDVKVRWTLSRSTIAAAFVAAFFLASEGAQILFGGGNEWVGLLAAGALVFALAPLQRAAERLAERAVPTTAVPAGGHVADREAEATYRRAVRLALRDRRLTLEEEVELAHVAHGLGLAAPQATRIRHEVESEERG